MSSTLEILERSRKRIASNPSNWCRGMWTVYEPDADDACAACLAGTIGLAAGLQAEEVNSMTITDTVDSVLHAVYTVNKLGEANADASEVLGGITEANDLAERVQVIDMLDKTIDYVRNQPNA